LKRICGLKIAGILLAGGLSSRMGQDKATLLLEQKTLLSRNVSLLSALNLSDVFVSGDYQGFQCINDNFPSLGPVGGLQACVEKLFDHYDALFVIPVDMPLLTKKEGEELLEQYKQFPQGVFYEKATFPMILPLTTQLKNHLIEAVNSSEKKHRSLYRLIKTVKLQPINYQLDNYFRFQNSNTPEEWANCLETFKALNEAKDQS